MAWRCSGSSNADLVARLAQANLITTPAVKTAMLAIDRGHFSKFKPYEASKHPPSPLSPDSPTAASLDVGSGSGYLTACMAEMVGPQGRVVGVDHIPELVDQSKSNTMKDHPEYFSDGRISYHTADGRVGYAKDAPYDCIHVGAAAESMHEELLQQLKSPGRMFIPVSDGAGQAIFVVDKDKDGKVTKKRVMDVWYVPLTDAKTQYHRF
ncbi:hypothetical protein BGZ50_006511 [Haplosporangium sp. Z 11]|nr:hypothetical protein BGZ50_006511 [Haplosporangium sp. Z 11]